MFCKNCTGKNVIRNIGHCSGCGSMTSSGMYKLCPGCSQTKNECQICRVSLAPPSGSGSGTNPGSNATNKLAFIVAVDSDHYSAGQNPIGREAVDKFLQGAFTRFMRDLRDWAEGINGGTPSDITVLTEVPIVCSVIIECDEETAERLRALPGVALVTPRDK